jgi:diguanylate cyclase (GGDEF)-like protein
VRTVRTPFLATRPATPRDYLSAGAVLMILLGIGGTIAPIGWQVAGPDIDVMSGCYIASVVCMAMISFLLYGQWRAGRHAAIGFLSVAFGFCAAMYFAFWLEYPGLINDDGFFHVAPGRIGYFWAAGHLGTFLLILAFAATVRRVRPADRPVAVAAIGTAAVAVALFTAFVLRSDLFPRLSYDGQFSQISAHILHPVILGFGLTTLIVVVAITRLQLWVDVYVAVFIVGLSCEAYLISIGPRKYSYGWYGSHWEIVIASLGMAIPLIRQVNVMYRQLTAENRRLARAAMVDPLTGIANRRAFDVQIGHLEPNTVLLIIDIDRFKNYNDLEGHRAGDDCIRRVARALAANVLRSDDLISRYGGDEFAAVLHDIDLDDAIHVAERIRLAVEDLSIPAHEEGARVTVSIGVAAYLPGEQPAELLRRADAALYRAKEGGRNRVAFDEESALETTL